MLRSLASRLSRTFLWMTVSALIVIGAQLYGPALVAGALPDPFGSGLGARPIHMTPETIMNALDEIRGALE